MRQLIVDGYNVIRSTVPYREVARRDDFDSARTALLRDVASFAQGDWRATVVFDGGGNPLSTGEPHELMGVTVIFSPYGMTADSVIEGLARMARTDGDVVEVVTSDAQTQWAVVGGTVARRSASEFSAELRRDEAEWREHASRGAGSVRIEDRIDVDVRATLERWARGEG